MDCKEDFKIRRSKRAKRARIIVTAEKIEVVAPCQMPERLIRQFMHAKLEWIETARQKVQQKVEAISSLAPEIYQQGELIPYQGKKYELQLEFCSRSQMQVTFDQAFVVSIPESWGNTLEADELSGRIRDTIVEWMGQAAAKQAKQLMDKYAALYQLSPRSITIKTQKSRWGSCGIHNDINLNWLLILAPVEVFEYVVIHELCHIAQRNHSAVFWALVARYCPDYKLQRTWLKQHGASLMQGL